MSSVTIAFMRILNSTRKNRKFYWIIGVLIIISILLFFSYKINEYTQLQGNLKVTNELDKILPQLAHLDFTLYLKNGNCEGLEYFENGKYIMRGCISNTNATTFTSADQILFDKITNIVSNEDTLNKVQIVEISVPPGFNTNGVITHAEFYEPCTSSSCRIGYLYTSQHKLFTEIDGEVDTSPNIKHISANWYEILPFGDGP